MNAATFEHEAMATRFAISIAGCERTYARQAATAAFRELDRLEGELSRFVESSDLARVNGLGETESTTIGPDLAECLTLAGGLSLLTRGAFDAAYLSTRAAEREPDAPLFALDAAQLRLTSLCPRLHLDLGAIGKGFALDRLAALLREWDISSALLESGGSTVLALAAPPGAAGWPIRVGTGGHAQLFALVESAASASGIGVQGSHLIDPRTGAPAARQERVWSFAESAAVADGLSTAFFIFDDDQIAAFCAGQHRIGAALGGGSSPVRCLGATPSPWPQT
jgi:thiamine biosynthesis lipoprotein